MTENKTNTAKTATMTRAEELKSLMAFAEENGYTGSTEKLAKVYEQWTKPRAKSAEPSKASLENKRLAQEVYEVMPEGVAVEGKWICEEVHGIPTPQKLTHVMSLLVNSGKVRKEKVGKIMTYTKIA